MNQIEEVRSKNKAILLKEGVGMKVTFKEAKNAWEEMKKRICISFLPENIQNLDKFFYDKCVWKEDKDEGVWIEGCGEKGWVFLEGDVKENNMKYCPFCGKEIEVKENQP